MRARRAIAALACGLLASGCVSGMETDLRLTALARTALPRAGQSLSQTVADASDCRERIMDSLVFVGVYTLYNPFATWSRESALRAREARLARCLDARGYSVGAVPLAR